MKRTTINGLRTNKPTVPTKTEIKNIDGNIIEIQNMPQFDGPSVTIKGGNSNEFWAKYPKNGNQVQMSMGAKLLAKYFEDHPGEAEKNGLSLEDITNLKNGKTSLPNHTLHHKHTGSQNDCTIQIVDKWIHQKNPHCGGMLTSNADRMVNEAKKQGTLPKNRVESVCNNIEFMARKNPTATSIVIGTGISAVLCGGYNSICKRIGVKPSKWGYAACIITGTAIGIFTHDKLNDGNNYL